MSIQDPSSTRKTGKGLMTWIERGLGLGESDRHETEGEADSAAPDALPMPPDTPRRAARRQMLADIANFIMTHDLEVNTFTLSTAHDYLAGHDRHLTRAIDEKLGTREPLSQPWLEDAAQRSGGKDHGQALNRLMQRMEADLEAFAATTTSAQSATTDYNQTLEAHVGDLARPSGPPPVEELVSIARAMLERTRELEHEMERSVAQTRNLRRSLDDARRRADHDHLTGLPNRRAFEACFTKEYATAKSNGEQLCVAFCDIDHFKRINDTHGHDAGDRVLKVVADTLAHISNDRCHVARHGGEEFVVLLRGRSVHQAWELLDETRDQMARREMVNRATDEPFGQVTFSAGLADVFAFDDPRSALGAADKALYQAKDQGRNRIILAERPAKG